MVETDKDTVGLDDFFEAARRDTAQMPPTLAARVLGDAAQVQAHRDRAQAQATAKPAPGMFRQVLDILGGWPTIGGMAIACGAGVWIGFAPPDFLPDPLDLIETSQTGFDMFVGEGMVILLSEEG